MLAARWRLSPNFIPLAAVFLVSGGLLYTGALYAKIGVFVFVTAGWIVSLCLHEAAHAWAAWYGGDRSVLGKGYLSLDPLVYAHRDLSFVMPILFLMLGGIGLPGGAVYIDTSALRSRGWDSFVSLAGPLANIACFVLFAMPFLFGLPDWGGAPLFWYGLAFLVALQISAVLLNLLPLPGLDGFGILRPFLPHALQQQARAFGPALSFLLLFLFMLPEFSRPFWGIVASLANAFGVSAMEISYGIHLFRFWQ